MPPSKKPPAPGAATPDIKRRVLICLDKLSDRDTFSQAAAELEFTARSLSPDTGLSPFLSCLMSVDSAANHKAAARAHSLRLISSLAALHGDSFSPHLPRILSSYVPRRLRDPDSTVRSACVEAVSSLARHVRESPFRLILDPLQSAMSTEQDLNVQIGAAMCLSAAVDAALSENVDAGELRRALPRMVKLVKSDGFKAKPAVWGLIGSVVAADAGVVVNGRALMGSVVGCAVDSLGSEDWAERKAAAEALERLAVAAEDRDLLAEVKRLCVDSLEKRRFDKVKNAREAMNRALEAWREVPGEDSLLSRSNSSSSKDYSIGAMSPPLPKNYNQAALAGGGMKTPSPQKMMTKSRSSLSDSSTVTGSPFISKSYTESTFSETPQSKRTLSKSRSSLSSLSSMSDESNPTLSKARRSPSLPIRKHNKQPSMGVARKPVDWKIEIVVPRGSSSSSADHTDSCGNLDLHEDNNVGDESATSSDCIRRADSREEYESECEVVDVDVDADAGVALGEEEEEYDKGRDLDDLTCIRKQLLQIEKQQSTLMNLLENFMGRSQSGLDSLETRVSGLEKALDKITYSLAVQSGRAPNEESWSGNTCCMIPAAEFLSPKFWRRTEGRFGVPKSMSDETGNWGLAALQEHNEVNPQKSDTSRDLGRSRGEVVNSPRVQACSGAAVSSFGGGAFSSTYFKPVVPRT